MDTSRPAAIDAVSSRKALPPAKRQYRSPELKRQMVEETLAANSALTVRAMLQAATATSPVVLARPLRLDADEIRRLLDVGAQGILCPFINNGDEASALASACRYPTAGIRGYP
jgi:2-keto-3-deoxy-L-rhamnonate aldolase RhmA